MGKTTNTLAAAALASAVSLAVQAEIPSEVSYTTGGVENQVESLDYNNSPSENTGSIDKMNINQLNTKLQQITQEKHQLQEKITQLEEKADTIEDKKALLKLKRFFRKLVTQEKDVITAIEKQETTQKVETIEKLINNIENILGEKNSQ